MTDYSKIYDDKQYIPNMEYTILVLNKEVNRLENLLQFPGAPNEIRKQLQELKNNISFLKTYR